MMYTVKKVAEDKCSVKNIYNITFVCVGEIRLNHIRTLKELTIAVVQLHSRRRLISPSQ